MEATRLCTVALVSAMLFSVAPAQHAGSSEPPSPMPEQQRGDAPPRPARAPRPQRIADFIPDSIELVTDVVYAQATDDDGRPLPLTMDTAFLKQSDGEPMPVVVYIHGGGWRAGSKEAGLPQMIAFARGGYLAVSINYRLAHVAKCPAAVHDCKAAIRFLRAHAEELHIDPNRIGVWGHSAGAHLAALLGTSGNSDALEGEIGVASDRASSAVQCVVEISGPVDLSRDSADGVIANWLGGPIEENRDLAEQASPLTYVDADDPPVLIIHGTADNLVGIRHARLFEEALRNAGVAVELLAVEGEGHAITQPRAYVRAASFFDRHLGGNAAGAMTETAQRLSPRRAQRDRRDRRDGRDAPDPLP